MLCCACRQRISAVASVAAVAEGHTAPANEESEACGLTGLLDCIQWCAAFCRRQAGQDPRRAADVAMARCLSSGTVRRGFRTEHPGVTHAWLARQRPVHAPEGEHRVRGEARTGCRLSLTITLLFSLSLGCLLALPHSLLHLPPHLVKFHLLAV